MSTDTRHQIRGLAEFHRANRRPVDLHEVQGIVGGAPKPKPRRSLRGPALAVAVMAAVMVLIGGLALLLPTGGEAPPADTVTPTTLMVPTTVTPTPSTDASVESSPGTRDLVWQRIEVEQVSEMSNIWILDGDDRFVLFVQPTDGSGTRLFSSVDGSNWQAVPFEEDFGGEHAAAAWQDTILVVGGGGGWSVTEDGQVFSTPSVVSVIHPDGSVGRRVFDGDVLSAAVGQTGLFVTLQPHSSYGVVIDRILGAEFSRTLYQAEVRDGVLFVRREPDGETAEIVLAEHDLTENDLNSPVATWYSQDGDTWMPVPDAPSDLGVVATSAGFVGVTRTDAWHSENGLDWERLGDLPFEVDPWFFSQQSMRWRQGAVATDLSGYVYISADGIEPLPDPPIGLSSLDQAPFPLSLAGDLGIVIANPVEKELLFTQDGENWHTGTLPNEMTDSFGWHISSGAVSSEAVLLLLWEEDADADFGQRPAWWLGRISDE